jgi:hypothetical protein
MRRLIILLTPVLLLAACGDDSGSSNPQPAASGSEEATRSSDWGQLAYSIDPADFVDEIDNPYLPYAPGDRWVYEETSDGETERVEVVVTDEEREVMGVPVTVVRDTVTVDGEMVEDTFDWFAQDRGGNVWYFGEEVDNFEDGELVDHDGSWEAGVDGALPGILMLADPLPGEAYPQEYYPGEAEDLGQVLRVDETVSGPAGEFTDVVVTRDWNPLEPEVVENKYFAPGVGLVYETKVAGEEGELNLLESTRLNEG